MGRGDERLEGGVSGMLCAAVGLNGQLAAGNMTGKQYWLTLNREDIKSTEKI